MSVCAMIVEDVGVKSAGQPVAGDLIGLNLADSLTSFGLPFAANLPMLKKGRTVDDYRMFHKDWHLELPQGRF